MKFHITDENGETCVVEELEKEKETHDEEPEIILSKEEIIALKSLIPDIEKIKALIIEKEEEKEEVSDEEKEEEVEVEKEIDEDEKEEDLEEEIDEDDDEEEIIDTDEESEEKIHDSVGAINKKNASTNDSAFDIQVDIATAWAKRYNGGNK